MAELSWQRILVGMIILIFTFTVYNTIVNPDFLAATGLTGLSENQLIIFMGVLNPIIVLGIITGVMFFVFGAGAVTSIMVAVLGFVIYLTFTNTTFMSIIGLSPMQQAGAMNWLSYLQPVIISGIILAAAVILLQVRGD